MAVAPIEFDPRNLVKVSRTPLMPERMVMVDTNYLIQLNQEDIIEMFIDPRYEDALSPLKNSMARLFRDAARRKVDLCLSDLIIRESICHHPRFDRLAPIYQKHATIITPGDGYDRVILDIAAAIGACALRMGGGSLDVKDTYSYVLALLSGVRYFVTEDADLERVYKYISQVRAQPWDDRQREVNALSSLFKLMRPPTDDFPIETVCSFILSTATPLAMPIRLANLHDNLPDILNRYEVITWMFNCLIAIKRLEEGEVSRPPHWDSDSVEKCSVRIQHIGSAIGLENIQTTNAEVLARRLLERANDWEQEESDQALSEELADMLNLFQEYLEKDEEDYGSLEDKFEAREPTKTFVVECDACNHWMSLELEYQGVVDVDTERSMGTESTHEWEFVGNCSECQSEIELRYKLWEYPPFFVNTDDTECLGCKIILRSDDKAQRRLS